MSTKTLRAYVLSMQMLKRLEETTEGETEISVLARHSATITTANSLADAEQIGREIAQRHFPAEEGWDNEVTAIPFDLKITLQGKINKDGSGNADIHLEVIAVSDDEEDGQSGENIQGIS